MRRRRARPTKHGRRSTPSPSRCDRRYRSRAACARVGGRCGGAVETRPRVATRPTAGSAPSGEAVDERVPLEREGAYVGVDAGRDLIDGHEQGELAGAQRVEDLTVVVAGPDVSA